MSIIVHLFENMMSDQGQKHVNIDTRMTHDRGACAINDSEQVSESLENLQVCAQGDFNTSMYSSLSRSRNRSFELIARFHKSSVALSENITLRKLGRSSRLSYFVVAEYHSQFRC